MSEILIYQNENGNIKVDVMFEDGSTWLSQTQICEVFGKAKSAISEHIKAIFEEGELDKNSVVRNYRTTTKHGAIEGKTQTNEEALERIVAEVMNRERKKELELYKLFAGDEAFKASMLDSFERVLNVFSR